MKLIRKLIFLAVAMAVISTMTGCAALFNFEPPPSDKVVLGETKFSQVQKQLGAG
jgi:predicted small lipoprotein YifL